MGYSKILGLFVVRGLGIAIFAKGCVVLAGIITLFEWGYTLVPPYIIVFIGTAAPIQVLVPVLSPNLAVFIWSIGMRSVVIIELNFRNRRGRSVIIFDWQNIINDNPGVVASCEDLGYVLVALRLNIGELSLRFLVTQS